MCWNKHHKGFVPATCSCITVPYSTTCSPVQCTLKYNNIGTLYAQVFTTDFGWVCTCPMKTKCKDMNVLFLRFSPKNMFPCIGVDDYKDLDLINLGKKLLKFLPSEADWAILSVSECLREIKMLKQSSWSKMLARGVPGKTLGWLPQVRSIHLQWWK